MSRRKAIIAVSLLLLADSCFSPRRPYHSFNESNYIHEQKLENLEEKIKKEVVEINLKKEKYNNKYVIRCEPSYDFTLEEKMAIAYVLSRNRLVGFKVWVEKLKEGDKQEKEKWKKYIEANPNNPNFDFNEEIFLKTAETLFRETGWSWEVLLAVSLQESIFNQIYGRDDEGGPFHALPRVAREYARRLGIKIKEDTKTFLSKNPDKALLIYLRHMHDLLKTSNSVEEALAKYNAGKYWEKYLGYAENVKGILKEIFKLEEQLKNNPIQFWGNFWERVDKNNDTLTFNYFTNKQIPIYYLYAINNENSEQNQNRGLFPKVYQFIRNIFSRK